MRRSCSCRFHGSTLLCAVLLVAFLTYLVFCVCVTLLQRKQQREPAAQKRDQGLYGVALYLRVLFPHVLALCLFFPALWKPWCRASFAGQPEFQSMKWLLSIREETWMPRCLKPFLTRCENLNKSSRDDMVVFDLDSACWWVVEPATYIL